MYILLLTLQRCLHAIQNTDHESHRRYQQVQVSSKMGCPAKIYVYEHVRFPQYEMSMHIHHVSKIKLPTFKLSVTLSNLNRFSKFLHRWKAYEICYKTHMTLLISP